MAHGTASRAAGRSDRPHTPLQRSKAVRRLIRRRGESSSIASPITRETNRERPPVGLALATTVAPEYQPSIGLVAAEPVGERTARVAAWIVRDAKTSLERDRDASPRSGDANPRPRTPTEHIVGSRRRLKRRRIERWRQAAPCRSHDASMETQA